MSFETTRRCSRGPIPRRTARTALNNNNSFGCFSRSPTIDTCQAHQSLILQILWGMDHLLHEGGRRHPTLHNLPRGGGGKHRSNSSCRRPRSFGRRAFLQHCAGRYKDTLRRVVLSDLTLSDRLCGSSVFRSRCKNKPQTRGAPSTGTRNDAGSMSSSRYRWATP